MAVGIPEGGGVLRLNIALVHGSGVELPLDDVIGLGKALRHIALFVLVAVGNVAVLVGGFAKLGGGKFVVQQRGVIPHSVPHIVVGAQDFVVHLDEADGFLGDVDGIGGHAGDGVSPEQGFGAGQDVVAGGARRQGRVVLAGDGQVGAGYDGAHAGQGFGGGGVNGLDARMGVGAPQDFAVQHPAHLEVAAVLGAAGHLVGAVRPDWPGAHDLVIGIGKHNVAHKTPRGQKDWVDQPGCLLKVCAATGAGRRGKAVARRAGF